MCKSMLTSRDVAQDAQHRRRRRVQGAGAKRRRRLRLRRRARAGGAVACDQAVSPQAAAQA